MNLKEQQYVVAIAQTGSITRAAEKLQITQPALSSYIANLERALHVKLFSRVAKKLIPTYAGELYIHTAKKMLELKKDFDGHISDITDNQKGRLRIGLQIRRSPIIIPSFYSAFHQLYPKVEIIFVEGVLQRLEQLLLDNELDLVLANKTHDIDAMKYIHIANENLLLAVSKDHPNAKKGQWRANCPYPWIDLRRFADDTFILQRDPQSQRQLSNQLMQDLKIVPKKIIQIQNIEASTRMAASGIGISFILDSYKKHFSFFPEPVCFSVGDPPRQVAYFAMHKKGVYMPGFTDDAIEIIRNIL